MQSEKVVFYIKENILNKLPESTKGKVAVAGGAVRDLVAGEKVKDWDVFVQDEATEKEVLQYLYQNAKLLNENNRLSNFMLDTKWIQVIKGYYKDMSGTALIDDFDFVHCCAMVTDTGLKVHPEFFRCVATKHIMVNTLLFPLDSLARLQKYVKKGYTACNGTLLALAKAIAEVDFEDKDQDRLQFYPDGSARFVGID